MGWKIAICDDDAGQAARLQADVTDWAHGACAVTCFPSAEAFRFAGDTDWDILLLDVEMPGMSGIDLAKRLRGAGCRAEIIFITSPALSRQASAGGKAPRRAGPRRRAAGRRAAVRRDRVRGGEREAL